MLGKKDKITILDLGCGDANALRETKKEFGDRTYTVGVDIGRPPEQLTDEDLSYVDEYVTTPMEFLPLEWSNRFDYIASLQGLRYTFFPLRALSEVARVLGLNGEATLDSNYDAHWFPDWDDEKESKWESKIQERKLDDENYTTRRFQTNTIGRRFCARKVDDFHDTILDKMVKLHETYGIIHDVDRFCHNTWGWTVGYINMKKERK